jgi:transposase-like protein
MMRKRYTSAFKAKVVQELMKEEKTLAQIASEYVRTSDAIEKLEDDCFRRNVKPL